MINDDISGLSQKHRVQNNFDERLFAEYTRHPENVSFLECKAPSRSPQKCERYSASELTPVHSDTEGHQVLISETSTISDVKSQLRRLKQRQAQLREEYARDLQAHWGKLLATNQKSVIHWKKSSTVAFRKAKWKKIPSGKSKLVVRFVYLKPRPVHVVRRGVDFGVVMIRPRVRRELIVPIYQKILLRPAGLRRVVVRQRVEKIGYDWAKIRPSYVVYKVERRAKLDAALAPLEVEAKRLYSVVARRMQAPHKLQAYTTLGWIPPSWEEYYYQHHRYAGEYEEVYGHMLPYEFTIGIAGFSGGLSLDTPGEDTACVGYDVAFPLFMGYRSLATEKLTELLETTRRLGVSIPANVPDSFRAKDMLYPSTVVDRLTLLDSGVNPESQDEQLEALAASTVRSLRNGSDYVFNLPRSIGELKDSKETFRQGYDFCRWLARGTRTRLPLPLEAKKAASLILAKTGSAGLALMAAYLAWKFAIQPTIQDCVTLRDHSKEWLLATRRQLMESIAILKKSSSNILHIRSKFRGDDAVRQKSLRNVIADVEARSEFVELTSWTRFEPPLMVPAQFESNLQSPASFAMRNESVSGFEPSYRLATAPLVGRFRYDGDWKYTLAGEIPGGSVSGTIDVSDTGVSPVSFESDHHSVAMVESPWTDLEGQRLSTNMAGRQAEVLEKAQWPRVNTTGYVKNQVEGVVFARYQLQDLLEFLDYDNQNNSLETLGRLLSEMADWDKLLDRCYQTAVKGVDPRIGLPTDEDARVLASFDTIYVAWQLTPLSFVYDWMTTSDSIAIRLNNFLTEYSVPAPPALDGVWVTKRVELLAGRPKLELYPEERMCTSYVSDWYGGKMVCSSTGHFPRAATPWTYTAEKYWAFPKRVVTTHRLRYTSDTKVSLARSGLYAAKRGEYIDGGWETFLPQVRIRLNANKVGTLLGILAGFIAPKQ